MTQATKARVFMSGRSQHVTIPAPFRFSSDEVYIRRDPQNGDVILSQTPSWKEIFAMLDEAEIPKDFMADRDQGVQGERDLL